MAVTLAAPRTVWDGCLLLSAGWVWFRLELFDASNGDALTSASISLERTSLVATDGNNYNHVGMSYVLTLSECSRWDRNRREVSLVWKNVGGKPARARLPVHAVLRHALLELSSGSAPIIEQQCKKWVSTDGHLFGILC